MASGPHRPPPVSDLTSDQQEAILWEGTDVHVTGGPGSGKTAVLVRRVEHLLSSDRIEPGRMVVFASSPSAAHSLRNTFRALLPDVGERVRVSTLHTTCAEILRHHGSRTGLDRFSIYDKRAARSVVQEELREHGYGPESEGETPVLREIERTKGRFHSTAPVNDPLYCGKGLLQEIFPAYQAAVRRARALDDSDLILHARELFEENEDLLRQYRSDWVSFHVDDFHNWTPTERSLLSLVVGPSAHVFVTSDEQQRLRGDPAAPPGAEDFWAERAKKKRIELRRSFRPPAPVRALAASATGSGDEPEATLGTSPAPPNGRETGKEETPAQREEATTTLFEAESARDERRGVAQRIHWLCEGSGFSPGEVAVLARDPDVLLPVAEHLAAEGIPVSVEPRYRAQEGVRDLLSYLQVAANPHDDRRLLRIVNKPSRGIGPKTKERVCSFARTEEISVWEALHRLDDIVPVTGSPQRALREFRNRIAPFVDTAQSTPPAQWARPLIEESGFLQSVTRGNTKEHLERQERVEALLKELESQERADSPVHSFLDEVWLDGPPVTSENHVRVLPVHEARGLEVPIVFLVGLEEGRFPRANATRRAPLLALERRAFYVGLTRAQERLFLSWAKTRDDVSDEPSVRSRFLDELDTDRYELEPPIRADRGRAPDDVPAAYSDLDPHYYRDNLRARQQEQTADPNPTEEETKRIRKGLRVEHAKMGAGTVLHTEGDGMKRIAIINFDERGQKKIKLRYAPLTIIGEAEGDQEGGEESEEARDPS